MTTYYTICAQRHDYDEWASDNLYESFDDACDAMDEEIRNYDEYRISEYKKPNREEKFKQIQEREYVVYHRSPREHEFIIKTMKVVPKKPDTVDCDEEDKYLEANFEEVFKRSREVKYLNGRPVRNTWYDPVKTWAYQVYFSEGEKPHTFYDLESRNIKTIDFVEPKKYVYQYWVENNILCGPHTKSSIYTSFDEVCDALDRELSELHGKPNWKPRMTREEFKEYMGDYPASTYDFFKTDTYVLYRTEV
jgi:ribosome-associated translation inhibitor RaiA